MWDRIHLAQIVRGCWALLNVITKFRYPLEGNVFV